MTTLVLLRLRYKLTVHGRKTRVLLVEDAAAVAFEGLETGEIAREGVDALAVLEREAERALPEAVRIRTIEQALARLGKTQAAFGAFAQARAAALAEDHARVRDTVGAPRTTADAVMPPDVLGVFVVMPE